MNDLEKAEIKQNKAIRGYIIRCLVKGYNNTALTRQLSNAMIAAGLIISPDISKYLDYLQGAGYIEFTEEKVREHSTDTPRKSGTDTTQRSLQRSII